MDRPERAKAAILAVGLAGWTAFWFWAFSFAYDDGFFRYHLHARLPTFLAALSAAVALPISAYFWWRRSAASGFRALVGHTATCLCVLALPAVVGGLLSAAGPPWHLEADDAMGVAFDFLLLLGIAVSSIAVMGLALGMRWFRRGARSPASR